MAREDSNATVFRDRKTLPLRHDISSFHPLIGSVLRQVVYKTATSAELSVKSFKLLGNLTIFTQPSKAAEQSSTRSLSVIFVRSGRLFHKLIRNKNELPETLVPSAPVWSSLMQNMAFNVDEFPVRSSINVCIRIDFGHGLACLVRTRELSDVSRNHGSRPC